MLTIMFFISFYIFLISQLKLKEKASFIKNIFCDSMNLPSFSREIIKEEYLVIIME